MQIGLDPLTLLIVFATIVIAISIHEMMHAFVGLKLGDTTAQEEGRVSLNPLRHIDPFLTIVLPIITLVLFQAPILAAKPVPFNPDRVKFDEFGAAMIAFAGPLTNLVLAIIGAFLATIFSGSALLSQAFVIFTVINVGIFVFNMVPIPPLDGSRILYAFAPDSIRSVMASMEQFGIVIVFSLILLVPAFGEVLVNINETITSLLL